MKWPSITLITWQIAHETREGQDKKLVKVSVTSILEKKSSNDFKSGLQGFVCFLIKYKSKLSGAGNWGRKTTQSCKNGTKVRKEETISAWTPGSQGLFVILTNLLLSIILTLTPSWWCMDKFTLVKGDSFSWNLFNFCQINVIHALSKLQQCRYCLPWTEQVNTWQEWKIAMVSKKNSFRVWRPP